MKTTDQASIAHVLKEGTPVSGVRYTAGDYVSFPTGRAFHLLGNSNHDSVIVVLSPANDKIVSCVYMWGIRMVYFA